MTPDGRVVAVGTVLWLVVAIGAGALGVTRAMQPPRIQLVLAGLTAVLLVLFWTWPPLRRWRRAVDVRVLVAIHLTRLPAGAWFLVLYGRGELPYAFAVPGGWGDIAVAIGALLIVAFARPSTPMGWRAVLAWNVFGLIDILMVVATAVRQAAASPGSMDALLRLPLSVLPTFLVPIIIATHVVLFARLLASDRSPARRVT